MRFRRTLVLGFAVALAATATAGAAKTPRALLDSLLLTKVTSTLPHGYKSPVVGAYTVSATAKSHHALGGAQILADGGAEGIIYIVFATTADAKADWESANFKGATTSAAPASIAKPSIVVNTSSTGTSNGKTIKVGITDVAALRGNVVVQAVTISRTSTKHGDLAGAVALSQFGLKHLTAVS